MTQKAILIIALIVCGAFNKLDWIYLSYNLSGTVFCNGKLLKSTTINYFLCKSQNCMHKLQVDENGHYSCDIDVRGACFSSAMIYRQSGKTFEEKYLKESLRNNEDSLVFYYEGKSFKVKNHVEELINDYLGKRNTNQTYEHFSFTSDINF